MIVTECSYHRVHFRNVALTYAVVGRAVHRFSKEFFVPRLDGFIIPSIRDNRFQNVTVGLEDWLVQTRPWGMQGSSGRPLNCPKKQPPV